MKPLNNLITDVPGVKVGHQTILNSQFKTGVTAILPHTDNLFLEKLPATVHVINGFGKSAGLLQVAEMGVLESPIILTNTFGVGTSMNALIRRALAENPEIGESTGSFNPLVFECNDSVLNNLRGLAIEEEDVTKALSKASSDFSLGAKGAGTGMTCYGLKGGIGSASQALVIDGQEFILGCLVLTNFGQMKNLVVEHYPIGQELAAFFEAQQQAEKGSVIVILATDLPLSSRQLKRISKRASVGITRSGSFIGNGSGEVVCSFSTAHRLQHFEKAALITRSAFNENYLDSVFAAVADVVEEAVLRSLIHGETMVDRQGVPVWNLIEAIEELQKANFSAARFALLNKLNKLK
ncbi:P1 family peptidase [Enterococcus sp. HY326]|uniref:P1 family peptidase n=1 Tax=Enterococcus sp. HY326 TaxID=2971265 RepID=UPI00223EA4C8|nr:P1 family peptidase [Enterococcus sp. HY326]